MRTIKNNKNKKTKKIIIKQNSYETMKSKEQMKRNRIILKIEANYKKKQPKSQTNQIIKNNFKFVKTIMTNI